MSENIETVRAGAITTIRMARPEKKNALTAPMYTAMALAIDEAVADETVRVIVLAGDGGVFTSGNDLREFAMAPPLGADSPVMRFLTAISDCPKPLVAAVSGLAIGIGTTMLLHCDVVIADPVTTFSLPFINLGLVPEGASSLLLPRMLGHLRASALLMLGDPFDAVTAERHGLVTRLSAPGAADAEALAVAATLAAKAPRALRLTKALLKQESGTVASRLLQEGEAFGAQLRGPEFREALAAFMEKRAPAFGNG